jgi:sugar lactone lactonase YvrE
MNLLRLFACLHAIAVGIACIIVSRCAVAVPTLSSPELGTLELVTPLPEVQLLLDEVDGLTFDRYGNLIAALEIQGELGGVAAIDKVTGAATVLVRGISRADQIEFDAHGNLFVTSEISPASKDERIWQVTIDYDAFHRPVSASKRSLPTDLAIEWPEGLIALHDTGPYGNAGDLLVAEDLPSGRILRVSADGSTTPLISNLSRPEGMAFGNFLADALPALYVAETVTNRVLRIGPDGTAHPVAGLDSILATRPDNIEFGPDGYLYVSEDRLEPLSRVIRTNHLGESDVLATGFSQAQGLAFDPTTGDLYISEHELDRVWRVRFANALPGDFNRNGTVDAADYVAWWRTDRTPQGYTMWRANFGATIGAGSDAQIPVPEPAAGLLLVTAGIVGRRSRR